MDNVLPGTDQCPKVSIIMSVFNVEEHLKESIDSILMQTLKEIEIVCIDGGSTDHTCEIIEEINEKDGRIKLFEQTRPGIGAAKNNGIERSTGEFITFLDGDDFYVDPKALETMYDACKKNNVKVCGALRSTLFLDTGMVIDEILHREDCKGHPDGVLLDYREKQYDYHFHSYLYDRKMIMESDARFAEVSAYDDTHFFIRALLKAEKFYVVPVELYRYRCGPAYDWGLKKALDSIGTLTDQLLLTKKERLSKLHWLTVQRINYEYGNIFYKNVKNGSKELLDKLIYANNVVDSEQLDYVVENNLIDRNYLEPMMHRSLEDTILRIDDRNYGNKYLLEPLWQLSHEAADEEEVHRSLFERGIRCMKEKGIIFTVRLSMRKAIDKIRRK